MKKQLITIYILFIFGVIGLAQDAESNNKFTIGGIINYQQYKNHDPNINPITSRSNTTYEGNIWDVNLYAGYQISKNGMLGILGVFNQTKTEFSRYTLDSTPIHDTDQGLRNKYGIGILYRRYLNLNTFSRLYIQPSALLSKEKNGPRYDVFRKGEDAIISVIYDINLNFGLQFNIHKNWYIIVDLWQIGYRNSTTEYEEEYYLSNTLNYVIVENNLDFSFNIQDISIGVEYLF